MQDLKQSDIELIVNKFSKYSENCHHRYRSFDFCYSHFYLSKHNNQIDIERSCYVLWSYLASWGMLRGSSFLLQKNPSYLKDLVEFIYSQEESIWKIDVNDYKDNIEKIIELYKCTAQRIVPNGNRQLVLVTKVLLGTLGIVPAYDTYFCQTFRTLSKQMNKSFCSFGSVNKASLSFIADFYLANQTVIDNLQKSHYIYGFTGNKTDLLYTKVKIIDMYGFQKGLDLYQASKK